MLPQFVRQLAPMHWYPLHEVVGAKLHVALVPAQKRACCTLPLLQLCA